MVFGQIKVKGSSHIDFCFKADLTTHSFNKRFGTSVVGFNRLFHQSRQFRWNITLPSQYKALHSGDLPSGRSYADVVD